MEPPSWKQRGPYPALRQAVRWWYLAPRLLDESAARDRETWQIPAENDIAIEDVDVVIDGETHRGQLAKHGPAFACYLLLPETRVALSGCEPPERFSLVQIDRNELISLPRAWGGERPLEA